MAIRRALKPARMAGVDAVRAAALVAMIAYHFCFDLRYYGVLHADFEHDPYWIAARTLILSTFLFMAGVSAALAAHAQQPPASYWRHIGIIAGCALLVSAGSYALFPRTFIWFGVLHAIAISLALAYPLVRRPRLALAIGLVVIVIGNVIAHPAFDNRALGWLGFMTSPPWTEDYVPLFPWAGIVFCGIPAGAWLARLGRDPLPALANTPRGVLWLGRHTLVIYMLHQPILMGLLSLVLRR